MEAFTRIERFVETTQKKDLTAEKDVQLVVETLVATRTTDTKNAQDNAIRMAKDVKAEETQRVITLKEAKNRAIGVSSLTIKR